jgi:hypothetical protein
MEFTVPPIVAISSFQSTQRLFKALRPDIVTFEPLEHLIVSIHAARFSGAPTETQLELIALFVFVSIHAAWRCEHFNIFNCFNPRNAFRRCDMSKNGSVGATYLAFQSTRRLLSKIDLICTARGVQVSMLRLALGRSFFDLQWLLSIKSFLKQVLVLETFRWKKRRIKGPCRLIPGEDKIQGEPCRKKSNWKSKP